MWLGAPEAFHSHGDLLCAAGWCEPDLEPCTAFMWRPRAWIQFGIQSSSSNFIHIKHVQCPQCHSSAGSLLHLTADTALQVMPCAGNWLIQVNPPLTLSTCSNEDRNCCLHVAQCAGSLKGLLGERGAKVSVSTHSGFAKEARGKKSPRHCSLISVCCWMDVRAAGRASAAEHLPAPGEEVLFCMCN